MSADVAAARLPARREPRLVARFLLVTVVGLVLAGVGISVVVVQTLARQTQRQAIARDKASANALLDHQLHPSDFGAVSRGRRRVLARVLAPSRLEADSLGARLYAATRVVESTAAAGVPPADAARLKQAETGESVSYVTRTPAGLVLRTLVPVRLTTSGHGVLELVQRYGPLARSARRTAWYVAAILEGLLVGLCVLLVPMLARSARRQRDQLDELDRLASHDALTGLLNRPGFYRLVDEELAAGSRGAVVLVDLDDFHEVNETIGSKRADDLLVSVAERLASTPTATCISRLGEDEFAFLFPEIGERELPSALEPLHAELAKPFETAGIHLAMAGSIGVAFYPAHGGDAETLLRHASTALSNARDDHAPLAAYTPDHERRDVGRLSFASELRDAVRQDRLVVHYQPQRELESGRLTAVEALVRWPHHKHGLLSAGQFIEAAERAGLTGEIGRCVLAAAIRQWRSWDDRGITVDIAVNLSTTDLLDLTLPGTVTEQLIEHAMPAERLVVEITERTLLRGEYQSNKVLRQLDQLGVRLSIDDYGTGYSSLSVLRRLPVRQVKIDKSFIDGLPHDRENDQIVQSTIRLAHTLGAVTVAEGVETPAQLTHLAELGCDLAQGYLLGRPCAADRITQLMHEERRRSREPDPGGPDPVYGAFSQARKPLLSPNYPGTGA